MFTDIVNVVSTDIVNVVSKIDLGFKVDLSVLLEKIDRCINEDKEYCKQCLVNEYDPQSFPGLVIRFSDPKSTILVFSSGKIVSTGATSVEQSEQITNMTMNLLSKCGYRMHKAPSVKIENIVASVIFGRSVDLLKCASRLPKIMYEPEQFPAIIFRMIEPPKATILLYSSGKFICTGLKTESDLYLAISKLREILTENEIFA